MAARSSEAGHHGGRILSAVSLACATALGSSLFTTGPAFATTCSGGYAANHFGAKWWDDSDNHVAGARAPVQNIQNGSPCTPGSGAQGSADWIGIEGGIGELEQIGVWNYNDGGIHYCKFFEELPNPPTAYGCGLSNGYTYFEVLKYSNSGNNFYAGYDCGTSTDYSSCSVKFELDPVFSTDNDDFIGETQRNNCQNQLMGNNTTNPLNIGNGAHPAEVKHDISGSWTSGESLLLHGQDGGTCGHYHISLPHPNAVTIGDDRND